jgi:hypothetical protein
MARFNLWPTPTATDHKGGYRDLNNPKNGEQLANQVGGQLNPTWVEWLMGFPLGWTDLRGLATQLCPRSQKSSEEQS